MWSAARLAVSASSQTHSRRRREPSMPRLTLSLMLLLASECAPVGPSDYRWHRLPSPVPRSLASDQTVEVWTHGSRFEWVNVVVDADFISGTSCPKDCRRASLPLSEVDSLRYRAGLRAKPLAELAVASIALIALITDPRWK
jgi:hypothetical protein